MLPQRHLKRPIAILPAGPTRVQERSWVPPRDHIVPEPQRPYRPRATHSDLQPSQLFEGFSLRNKDPSSTAAPPRLPFLSTSFSSGTCHRRYLHLSPQPSHDSLRPPPALAPCAGVREFLSLPLFISPSVSV